MDPKTCVHEPRKTVGAGGVPGAHREIKVLPVELLRSVAELVIKYALEESHSAEKKIIISVSGCGPSRPCLKNSCPQCPESGQTRTDANDPEQTNRQGNCSPAFLQDTANLLVQFLAQFSIELVSIDRPVKRYRSAFSLNIRKNKCHPWTRVFCRGAIARLRNDFPRRDHVPCATRRCSRSG